MGTTQSMKPIPPPPRRCVKLNGISRYVRKDRIKEGMEIVRDLYGRTVRDWELPTLAALETDISKKALIIALLDLIAPDSAAVSAERARCERMQEMAKQETEELIKRWGLE